MKKKQKKEELRSVMVGWRTSEEKEGEKGKRKKGSMK